MPKPEGILLCGGGTGGHVLPGLAVAAVLSRQGEGPLSWIGDPARIESRLVPQAGIRLLPLGLSRPRIWDPRWILSALGQAWRCWQQMRAHPPRVVVALGGYASLLPGLIAGLCGRPLVVMEQNARVGRTNRILSLLACKVVTQFAEAGATLPAHKIERLGNPVRAIDYLPRGTSPGLRILVCGGSLAAKSLNDLVASAAPLLGGVPGLTIVHLAGEEDRARVGALYAQAGLQAEVHGFYNDMPELYGRIDVAVTRAGATTVAELCAAGIPALYIPLPWAAHDHQTANAQALARVGAGVVLPQATTTPALVAQWILRFHRNRGMLMRMGGAARNLARPQAAGQVARLVLSLDPRQARRGREQARQAARQRAVHAHVCWDPDVSTRTQAMSAAARPPSRNEVIHEQR